MSNNAMDDIRKNTNDMSNTDANETKEVKKQSRSNKMLNSSFRRRG